MKKIILTTLLIGSSLLGVSTASAQSARFEAFAESRIVRGDLPINALTREQQAEFGVSALAALHDSLDELLPLSADLNFFEGAPFLENLVDEIFDTTFGQNISLFVRSPRDPSAAFTTVRSLRESGLIRRGGNRFNRSEFAASNLFEEVGIRQNILGAVQAAALTLEDNTFADGGEPLANFFGVNDTATLVGFVAPIVSDINGLSEDRGARIVARSARVINDTILELVNAQ